MPISILTKYEKIKIVNSNLNLKTYLARIEPIEKEIIPNNLNEYYIIK